jgi:two-component system OmpR family sensor kinase
MDGLKRRLSGSIQFRLSFWLSLAILVVALVAGVFSFWSAFKQAHELQDDVLRQVAALLDSRQMPLPPPGDSSRATDGDEESRVIVQQLAGGSATRQQVDAGAPLPLPLTLRDGLTTVTVDGEAYRVLVKTMASGERVAVAQETGLRDEIARDSALRTVTPFLVLVPILLLVVANLVRRMFRPIASLAVEIDQRGERDLRPVRETHLPSEVRPFIAAINDLLDRVARSMETQRRFVADAAHELRSPLTALSLQAERLADADMSAPARERLLALRQGMERSRNLLDQLLALARAQSAPELAASPVSVQAVYRRVLEDLMPLAEAKRIDIGVEDERDAQVRVDQVSLVALVKNLVDNAIRYTPEDGRVDLAVATDATHAILRVTDSGPGIPPVEHDRVFDPFYRVLGSDQVGSGLGLSIVRTVAERFGAGVSFRYADKQTKSGLCVTVLIPLDG